MNACGAYKLIQTLTHIHKSLNKTKLKNSFEKYSIEKYSIEKTCLCALS